MSACNYCINAQKKAGSGLKDKTFISWPKDYECFFAQLTESMWNSAKSCDHYSYVGVDVRNR